MGFFFFVIILSYIERTRFLPTKIAYTCVYFISIIPSRLSMFYVGIYITVDPIGNRIGARRNGRWVMKNDLLRPYSDSGA